MHNNLDISPLSVLELPPPDFVACAAESGFHSVSLRLLPTAPHEAYYSLMGNTPLANETEKRLTDCELSVLETEGMPVYPESRVAHFMPVLDATARFHATKLVIVSRDPDVARFTETFASICDQASLYGIEVNLEFMPISCIKSLDAALDVIRTVDRRNAGIIVDVLHFLRSGSSMETLRAARAVVNVLHLCDVRPGPAPGEYDALVYETRCARCAPGQGCAAIAGILEVLRKDVAITVEVPDDALRLRMAPVDRLRMYRMACEKLLSGRG